MNTKKTLKVIGAIGAGVVLIGAGAFTTGLSMDKTVQEQVAQISQLELDKEALDATIVDFENAEPVIEYVEVEKLVEVEKIVEVDKIVELEVEIEVDNGNLDLVLDHIYDNDGSVEYLLDDLDDDEVDQIVDRVVFINGIKTLAATEVDNEIADLLDKEEFTYFDEETQTRVTVKFDEDDIERIRVQDDDDELEVIDVDFKDKDADVEVEVHFEQDDVKYKALVTVEFKDGETDDVELESIEIR